MDGRERFYGGENEREAVIEGREDDKNLSTDLNLSII